MVNIEFRESTLEDIKILSKTMREPDRVEVLAMGMSPEKALLESFNTSSIRLTFLFDGKVICMFGIAPKSLLGDRAVLWCLTSDELERVKLLFGKKSKYYVGYFLTQYSILDNWVDSRYKKSIKWLRWLGADFDCITSVNEIDFYHFEIRRR